MRVSTASPLYDKRLEPEARRVLRVAADLIDTGGWIRHTFRRGDARCALGAIRDATYQVATPQALGDPPAENVSYVAQILMRDYLIAHERDTPVVSGAPSNLEPTYQAQSIAMWNDYYAPDEKRVVEVLRAVGAE